MGVTETLKIPKNGIYTQIYLIPTKIDLYVESLPADYDCFFNLINDEAADLVQGADAVEFLLKC